MTTIAKRFTFEAAHRLPNHDGKCRNLHGHSYQVEVGVTGPLNRTAGAPDEGMVIDFAVLKDAFTRRVFDRCDHQFLNDVLMFLTTAENLASWILRELADEIDNDERGIRVEFVRVWETASSYAEHRA